MEKDYTGNYPIIIDGKETGRINVGREGLFWCFEATSEMSDGIIRLSVFGDEAEGYLGIMEPKENRLRLKKKLSKASLGGFPDIITHGGMHGGSEAVAVHAFKPEQNLVVVEPELAAAQSEAAPDVYISQGCNEGETAAAESEPTVQYEKPPPVIKPPAFIKQETVAETPPHKTVPRVNSPEEAVLPEKTPGVPTPLVWKMCGCPAAHLSSLEAKSVFGTRKNVLEANDGVYAYLAVPEDSVKLTPAQDKIFGFKAVILGIPHLVCRLKNGRIV